MKEELKPFIEDLKTELKKENCSFEDVTDVIFTEHYESEIAYDKYIAPEAYVINKRPNSIIESYSTYKEVHFAYNGGFCLFKIYVNILKNNINDNINLYIGANYKNILKDIITGIKQEINCTITEVYK